MNRFIFILGLFFTLASSLTMSQTDTVKTRDALTEIANSNIRSCENNKKAFIAISMFSPKETSPFRNAQSSIYMHCSCIPKAIENAKSLVARGDIPKYIVKSEAPKILNPTVSAKCVAENQRTIFKNSCLEQVKGSNMPNFCSCVSAKLSDLSDIDVFNEMIDRKNYEKGIADAKIQNTTQPEKPELVKKLDLIYASCKTPNGSSVGS